MQENLFSPDFLQALPCPHKRVLYTGLAFLLTPPGSVQTFLALVVGLCFLLQMGSGNIPAYALDIPINKYSNTLATQFSP